MVKRREELPLAKPIKKMSKRRFGLIMAVLVGTLLILYLIISAGLSFNSITSGDLILFVEPSTEYLRLEHGQSDTLTYTLGVSNLPFCDATCSWSITDLATGTVLSNGTEVFDGERKQDYDLPLTAPASGQITKPYQFHVQCTNARTQYCKAEEGTKQAAVSTVVEVTYTEDEAEAYEQLRTQLPSWSAVQREQASALTGIANVKDSRVQTIAAQANADYKTVTTQYASAADYLSHDDVTAAYKIIGEPFSSSAVAAYTAAVAQERAAVGNYTLLYEKQDIVQALLALDGATRDAVNATLGARLSFNRIPPAQALAAFSRALNVSTDAVVRLGQPKLAAAKEGQRLLASEQRMICTLKAGTCPQTPAPPQTLPEVVATLRETCAALNALPEQFDAAQTAYALALEPTLTRAETEDLYNVSEIRADDGFTDQAVELRVAARNGTLLTSDPAMRLAVALVPAADALAFIEDNCGLADDTVVLPEPPVAMLPVQVSQPASLPSLALPEPQCCSSDVCAACGQTTPYPVVFVHGHSFTDSSSPEYNMYAFVPMALALQDEGAVYAGHVFARDDLDAETAGEMRNIPSPVMFTATYYYNSYPEEGRTAFVAHKSENIETYAIRLKEAIDVVQHKTGQQKVVIVAHSMGGLVVRRYLQIFGEDETAAVLLIGTPNYGITGRVSTLCPLLGGEKECDDMAAGSIFLAKLNNGRDPSVPFFTIAGTGCDGDFDGIVETERVALDFAQNTVVEGACESNDLLLHSALLRPELYPQVYEQVSELIEEYSR